MTAADAPNVLWLMTDEQRKDSLGCYGSAWAQTPAIDALAEGGVVFTSAYTPAPVCVPARASLLTGQYPSETGVWWNERHLQTLDLLTTRFADAGYRTASFGKQHYEAANSAFEHERDLIVSEHVHYLSYASRYDPGAFGCLRYPVEPFRWVLGGRFPAPAEETPEATITREATAWLAQEREEPFFLRVSYNAPHTPVAPPEPFSDRVPADEVALPAETERASDGAPGWERDVLRPYQSSEPLSAAEIRLLRSSYYGEAAFVDHLIGGLLDWMRPRGLLENTIVVFVSDHGTHLGDFGLVQKQTFYEPVVTVPFVVSWDGVLRPRTIERPVELRRLLPTLLGLCGLEVPPGRAPSLAARLGGATEPDAPVFSEFALAELGPVGGPPLVEGRRLGMVRDGRWKLSTCVAGGPADTVLFDLERDPHERRNAAADPGNADVLAALERRVREHLTGEEER